MYLDCEILKNYEKCLNRIFKDAPLSKYKIT